MPVLLVNDTTDRYKKPKYKLPPSLKQTVGRDKAEFDVKVHGIKRCRPKYWFRCIVPGCKCSFPSIKFWNSHHGIEHSDYKLICHTCNKWFCTPSAKRVYSNTHASYKHRCSTCGKLFPYESALKQHKHIHASTSMHKCFTGGCNKLYKWPQDLNRHIQTHTNLTSFRVTTVIKSLMRRGYWSAIWRSI